MNLRKNILLLVVFSAAYITPCRAQTFWTNQSPAGITDDIWCVTNGNGVFAATTSQGKVLTSNDGLTWSSNTVAQGTLLVSIAYGDGKWVAVGAGGTILVSSDLKTWVTATAVTTNKLNGVAYNGTVWLAVGDSATVITSTDALKWTVQTIPAAYGITGFLHGITLVPDNTSELSIPVTAFLICGAQAGNGTGLVDTGVLFSITTGGTNFSLEPTGPLAGGNLEAVINGGGTAIAVGWGGSIVYDNNSFTYGFGGAYRSGYYWYYSSSPTPNVIFRGLTYGNGYWVVAGEQGTIFTSIDGVNFTQRFSGDSPSTLSTATLLSATYSSTLQRFVITGTGGTILVSNPPPTVFANVSTRGFVSTAQTFIGGFVIEGTAPRTVLIRADGPVLSAFSVSSPLPDPVLTVYDGSGKVIATNTGWTTNPTPTTISTAALEVGAFALPNLSPDSALLLTLQPGAYTAQITSASGGSGTALFEAYTN